MIFGWSDATNLLTGMHGHYFIGCRIASYVDIVPREDWFVSKLLLFTD